MRRARPRARWLAGVVGPLIEVPALIGLVYASLWARRRFYDTDPEAAR